MALHMYSGFSVYFTVTAFRVSGQDIYFTAWLLHFHSLFRKSLVVYFYAFVAFAASAVGCVLSCYLFALCV